MSRANGRRKKKWSRIRNLIVLIILLATVWFIRERVVQDEEQEMVSYTVRKGTIQTYRSFSATLSVENSETFTNTEGVTTIRELYVSGGQEVKAGDPILTLGTGKTFEASIDGMVTEMRFKQGDYVWPNITLVQVCDLEHLLVQLQVDEYDVKKVEVGQQCVVTVVPLDLELETVISHVNRVSASNGRVAYYPVTARLDSPGDAVLPGMTVSVRIADDTAENVLVLPMEALSFNDEDEPCVQEKTENGYEMVPVSVGLSDGMDIEITDGLSEGDVVYAPKIGSDEEEIGVFTTLLRSIFGTKVVFNEEATRRGSRTFAMPGGEIPEGEITESEITENGMPFGTMPEGGFPSDGERPSFGFEKDISESEKTEATASEASKQTDGTGASDEAPKGGMPEAEDGRLPAFPGMDSEHSGRGFPGTEREASGGQTSEETGTKDSTTDDIKGRSGRNGSGKDISSSDASAEQSADGRPQMDSDTAPNRAGKEGTEFPQMTEKESAQ